MSPKQFEFTGKAGQYFIVTIVTVITYYIIIIGWPIGFNYAAGWIVDNIVINGKKLKYSAGYGETLVFLLVNILLLIITLGIYVFWFGPKMYRYVADHTTFLDETSPVSPATGAPASVNPAPPTVTSPTPPVAPSSTPPVVSA